MIQTSWSEEKQKQESPKLPPKIGLFSRRIFWALITGSLIALAAAGFYFYQYFTSRDIAFFLKSPENVYIGVPFNIEIELSNNSDKALNDVKLSMILPEGTALLGEDIDKRVYSQDFGDLEKNAALSEKIPVIIFGGEQSVKKFEIVASYFPPSLGPKARFETTKSVEVSAREPAIKFDLIAPQKVLNNEDFEIEINYQNISGIDLPGVELELQYPQVFTFINADPQPSSGNNFWRIGDLSKNAETKTIVLSGKAFGVEQSFFEIKSALRLEFFGQKYLIAEKNTSVNIASSPLSLIISVNDRPDYLVFPKDNLRYKITIWNNSEIGLNDAVLKAKLIGEMFDIKSLRTEGFFNSRDNTITWNAANTNNNLRLIPPNSQGTVEFEIKAKEFYPIKRLSDKNFVLKVEAEISSPTVPYYVASDKTIGLANSEIKVAGAAGISAGASYLKGYWPPKVDKPTNFTVKWTIRNYSTDISNVEAKAFLQSGVRFIGNAKSNIGSVPTYNERTQEIVWLIDKIPATKGVISKPVEASFQIEAVPNITQSGEKMSLMSQTAFKAFDEFVKIELKDLAGELVAEQNVVR
jgi:hypothetical protein